MQNHRMLRYSILILTGSIFLLATSVDADVAEPKSGVIAGIVEKNFRRDSRLTYQLSEKTFKDEPRDDAWADTIVTRLREVASDSGEFSVESGDCRTDICIFKITPLVTDALASGSKARTQIAQAAGPYDMVTISPDGRAFVYKLVEGASYLKRFSDGR